METATLYERLGSIEGITALVDDIVEAHMNNPAIRARFLPYGNDPDRLAELKGHLARFVAAGAGGPQEYEGRSMPAAHHGMNISDSEYMAALDDIMRVLDEHSIGEQAQKDVLMIVYSLRDDIVRA